MNSIFDFVFLFLIYWGFLVIAYKYNIEQLLNDWGNKFSKRFLHKLADCQFCIEHHIGVLIVPFFYWLIYGIEGVRDFILIAFTPFVFASMANIIKTLKK